MQTPKENIKPKTYNFIVDFSDSAWTTLTNLAERQGKTISEVLRDAIALEKFWQDKQEDGCRFLVETNGYYREVIPR